MEDKYMLCKKNKHPFMEISRVIIGFDEEKVVRWCPVCGGIVVDLERDNRLYPGYYKEFEIPYIVKDKWQEV